MKNQVILKIENANGVQEFPLQVKSWNVLIEVLFQDETVKIPGKTMKSLMQVCEDDSLIENALCYYRGQISGKEAKALMARFPKSKKIQIGLIAYGVENDNMTVIKAVAKKPLDSKIMAEVAEILECNE